ncbi:hypothetical protein pdam_00025755, partial [Pocillopora damicornis]
EKALGIGGFPFELTLNRIGKKGVLAVPFKKNTVSHLNEKIKIFRNIDKIENSAFFRHRIKEMACWAEHMSYAPQQLNFTVWCATTGCGISREVLDKVQEQTKSFLMIYVYFTVRRSRSFLPGDPIFSSFKNNYDKPSFKQRCAEFGISSGTDFRFKGGDNHSLGSVFIDVTDVPQLATSL